MRCPKCQAQLGHVSASGDPMLRTRGLVLKAEGVIAVCPKCRADVPATGELRKALILFLTRPPCPVRPSSS